MDGEKVVTAMAYTILRLHKNKILKLKDMDLIVQYLQVSKANYKSYDNEIACSLCFDFVFSVETTPGFRLR